MYQSMPNIYTRCCDVVCITRIAMGTRHDDSMCARPCDHRPYRRGWGSATPRHATPRRRATLDPSLPVVADEAGSQMTLEKCRVLTTLAEGRVDGGAAMRRTDVVSKEEMKEAAVQATRVVVYARVRE